MWMELANQTPCLLALSSTLQVCSRSMTAASYHVQSEIMLTCVFEVGMHDGVANGCRYFLCEPQCGVFVPLSEVCCVITSSARAAVLPQQPHPQPQQQQQETTTQCQQQNAEVSRTSPEHLSQEHPLQVITLHLIYIFP